jgi:hypothetical protein
MTKETDCWFSVEKLKLILTLLVCGLIGVGVAFQIRGAVETNNNTTFKLREVSAFEGRNESFLRGQICRCQDTPFPEVKNYPKFASQAPIFGAVRFGERSFQPDSGQLFYFAVDESRGTGKGYDRFYFDGNQDLDLRNDPAAKRQQPPPDHGYKPNFSGIKTVAAFDFLKVNLGTNGGSPNLVEIMPRLLITGDDKETYRYLFFVRTRLFEGDIRIAGKKFRAQLGNDHVIAPDFNFPGTALVLSGGSSFDWWGGDRVSAMHKVGGHFFSFSATQAGEVTVHPYQGDLGTFELGAGGRKLTGFGVSGSFQARDWAVPVGGDIQDGRPVEASQCQVPVGDYLPEYLALKFGRLRIELSQNYHSEGKRQSRAGRPDVFGITIRKDRPFALDFSNQPDVMFASPAPDQRVKPGDTVMVMAVLVDPKLDIMIRRLEDTSRKQTKDAEGKPLGYARNLSLDPTVIITRANGEKVAEGFCGRAKHGSMAPQVVHSRQRMQPDTLTA